MLRRLAFAFILLLVTLLGSTRVALAATDCNSGYSCFENVQSSMDCVPRSSSNACNIDNNSIGFWCCRNGGSTSTPPVSTPTPTRSVNQAAGCVANGNYCVPTAADCISTDTPNSGGVCPVGRLCCQRGGVQTPLPLSNATPMPPKAPEPSGFSPLAYPCSSTADPEFDPSRPYPGSPCDPDILKAWPEGKYTAFACGKSLNTDAEVEFPQFVSNYNSLAVMPTDMNSVVSDRLYQCRDEPGKVCVIKKLDFDVSINLANAELPILGNSEDDLDDATKVNQYLLSYFTGAVRVGDDSTPGAPVNIPVPENAQQAKILALGDSITAGYYPCELRKLMPDATFLGPNNGEFCSLPRAGYIGATAEAVLDKFSDWSSAATEAQYVLIHLGTNDIYSDIAEAEFKANLTEVIYKVQQQNPAAVVILSQVIPNKYNTTSKFKTAISQVATTTGAVLMDAGVGFDPTKHLSANDEVHPNQAGGAVMARNFLAAMSGQSTANPTYNSVNLSLTDRLINFAGPIKKLLPLEVQNRLKGQVASSPARGTQYHDYIVGCQKNLDVDYVKSLFDTAAPHAFAGDQFFIDFLGKVALFAISHANLVPQVLDALSYISVHGSLSGYSNAEILDNAHDILNDAIYIYGYAEAAYREFTIAARTISLDFAESCSTSDDEKRLSTIANGHLPPDPRSFENFNEYWKEYLAWSGRVDFIVDFGLGTSVWSQLFQDVPFSTLEDTVGEFTVSAIDDPKHQPEGVITNTASKPIKLTITSADSRLYFPHVKAVDALASLLQSLVAPKDKGSSYNPSGAIPDGDHQAIGDGPAENPLQKLTVVGPGQSSVVAGNDAPFPLFVSHDSRCDLKDVRVNPGDDLYGQQVTANLSYYQKFKYIPSNSGGTAPNPGAGRVGDLCKVPEDCEWNKCLPANLNGEMYCDGPATGTITQPTQARIATFTKVPLIETIYGTLVGNKNSLFRRFLPAASCEPDCDAQQRKQYIRLGGETIPAAIDASYTGGTAGDETGGGQLYIARLGSLFDYFLGASKQNQNLQKLLRPKGFGGQGETSSTPNKSTESMAQVAARLGVPVEFLDALWLIETNRSPSGSYCDCADGTACGPMGVDRNNFQLVLTPEEQQTFSQCTLPDAWELAARTLLHKKYCTLASCTYNPANPTSNGPLTLDDYEAVGRYMGTNNCEPHEQTQCRWGAGYSYCDAVRHIINFRTLPPPGSQADRDLFCDD